PRAPVRRPRPVVLECRAAPGRVVGCSLVETILVVDDDPGMCQSLADVLALRGYAVEMATRGGAALAVGAARPRGAASVDLKLPDMSGLDLLAGIKDVSPLIEVIFMTGYASLPSAIQAMSGGAFAYLVKPADPDQLQRTIERALEKRRLTRALQHSEERYRLV